MTDLFSTEQKPIAIDEARSLYNSGFSCGRWLGIAIRVDWSLLIVFALIAANLGAGVFPSWHPAWSAAAAWSMAVVAALLFFGSVLVHELAHALVARHYGIVVRRITLFLFGGLAHLESQPPSPKSEFLMAAVGPLVSFAIGLLATALGSRLAGGPFSAMPSTTDPAALQQAMTDVGPAATLLLWVGPINILLAVFNTVPGFPLDGGRVLRAFFWWTSGDLVKATRWAAGMGHLVAWVLITFGVVQMFGGMFGQGLWLILIGWFLNNAARMSYEQLVTRRLLQHVPVSRVMWTQPERIAPNLTIERFVQEHLIAGEQAAVAVESDGALLGIVAFDDVRKLPQTEWSHANVATIMTPLADLPTLAPDADADRALDVLARRDIDQIPVVAGQHLEGLVRRRDLVRWLALQQGDRAHAA